MYMYFWNRVDKSLSNLPYSPKWGK
jgi:hypothetical protein